MPNGHDSARHGAGRRLLRCDGCGRTDAVPPADLLRYTREGWPRCCGAVMHLFAEAPRPSPDDTATDIPALPPGEVG